MASYTLRSVACSVLASSPAKLSCSALRSCLLKHGSMGQAEIGGRQARYCRQRETPSCALRRSQSSATASDRYLRALCSSSMKLEASRSWLFQSYGMRSVRQHECESDTVSLDSHTWMPSVPRRKLRAADACASAASPPPPPPGCDSKPAATAAALSANGTSGTENSSSPASIAAPFTYTPRSAPRTSASLLAALGPEGRRTSAGWMNAPPSPARNHANSAALSHVSSGRDSLATVEG